MTLKRLLKVVASTSLVLASLWLLDLQPRARNPSGWTILLDGQSLKGWEHLNATQPNEWQTAADVKLNPQDGHFFQIQLGKGILVNGPNGKTVNLVSDALHGDIEAHIEFVVPKGSNSGIYFMGLYEIQVLGLVKK